MESDCISFIGSVPNSTSISSVDSQKTSVVPNNEEQSMVWCWLCKDCVYSRGEELVGKNIRVWWPGDAIYYNGMIDAFDSYSCLHRVVYVDGEWEFVDLSAEPYVLQLGASDETSSIDISISSSGPTRKKSSNIISNSSRYELTSKKTAR